MKFPVYSIVRRETGTQFPVFDVINPDGVVVDTCANHHAALSVIIMRGGRLPPIGKPAIGRNPRLAAK